MPDAPSVAPGPAAALAIVDETQRGIRDLLVAANPRVSWVRVWLFPVFLMLLGSDVLREVGPRSAGLAVILAFVALAVSGLVAERGREHAAGLHIAPRRMPRAGNPQYVGAVNLVVVMVGTNYATRATDVWWIGLPLGFAAAAVHLWGKARWAASFDRRRRSPSPLILEPRAALGPFASTPALQLGAALILSARVKPDVLADRLGLPPDVWVDVAPALLEVRLARKLHRDPEGRPILGFTRRGRRAFKKHLRALERA